MTRRQLGRAPPAASKGAKPSKARADIDWDDLHCLRATLREGSLTGAARALGVEHTTVGRRLTSLERTLGAALVVRAHDGVRPTHIGAELLPLLDDMDRAVDAICSVAVTRRSHVRVAAPSGFAALFHERIAAMRAQHPNISLEILSGARPVDLKRGEADVAVRVGPVDDDDLVTKRVGEAGWALYASRSYVARAGVPDDLDDLAGHDVIGYDDAMAKAPPAQWLASRTGRASVVLRSRDMTDMRDAAMRGVGLAVLPCGLGDTEPSLVRLTVDTVAARPISIVYRKEARLSASLRTVVTFLSETIAANDAAISGRRVRT